MEEVNRSSIIATAAAIREVSDKIFVLAQKLPEIDEALHVLSLSQSEGRPHLETE